MVPSLGFKTDEVYYSRKERMAGESKYPLSKMLALAAEGITSFSIEPMHVMTVVGIIALFVALIMLIYTIVSCANGQRRCRLGQHHGVNLAGGRPHHHLAWRDRRVRG
jgi:hypothetical protein